MDFLHVGIVGTVLVDKHCVPLRSSLDKASTQQVKQWITVYSHLNPPLRNSITVGKNRGFEIKSPSWFGI